MQGKVMLKHREANKLVSCVVESKGNSRKRNRENYTWAHVGGLTKISLKGAFEVCVKWPGVSFRWTRETWLCLHAEHKSPVFLHRGEVITCFGGYFFIMLMLAFWVFFYAMCVCLCVWVCMMGNTRVCSKNCGFSVWNLLLASYFSIESKINTR